MGKSTRQQSERALTAPVAPAAIYVPPGSDPDLFERLWSMPLWLKLWLCTGGLAVLVWGAWDTYQKLWGPAPSSPVGGEAAFFFVSHGGDKVLVLRYGRGVTKLATLVNLRTRESVPLSGDWRFGDAQWSANDEYLAGPVRRGDVLTPMLVHVPSRRHFLVDLPDRRASAHYWRWAPDGRSALIEAVLEPQDGALPRWKTEVRWVYEYDLSTHSVSPVCPGRLISVPQPFWGDAITYEVSTGRIDPPRPYQRPCFLGLTPGDPDPCQVLPKHWVYEVVVDPHGQRAVAEARPLVQGRLPIPADQDVPPTLYVLDYPSDPYPRRLCDGDFYDLAWSKAGDRLLACDHSARDRLNADIVTIDSSTGAITLLRDSQGRQVTGSDPVWIGDDHAIAYRRWYGPKAGWYTKRLWTYTFGTGEAKQAYPSVH